MDNKIIGLLIVLVLLIVLSNIGGKTTVEQGTPPTTSIRGSMESKLFATPQQCSPDPGYDWCDAAEEEYGYAYVYVELQLSNVKDVNGNFGQYMVGNAHANVKCNGKLYAYKKLNNWNEVFCNKNGCDGERIDTGEYVLAEIGEENPDFVAFVCWKFKEAEGNWAWAYVGRGWTGQPGTFSFKVVECNSDADCDNAYCDKSGSWTDWQCKTCPDTLIFNPSRPFNVRNKCIYQTCEYDASVEYSYCIDTTDNDLAVTQQQVETYLWECTADTDCESAEVCNNHFCEVLECDPGYKPENHQCVIGRDCETDENCFWCGDICMTLAEGITCPTLTPPLNKECKCVSSACTSVDKKPICTPGAEKNKRCVGKKLAYERCALDGYSWDNVSAVCVDAPIEHGTGMGYCKSDGVSAPRCEINVTCESGYTYNTKTMKCESVAPTYIIIFIMVVVIMAAFVLTRGGGYVKGHRYSYW